MKEILLTQEKVALVDDEDYEKVISHPYAWWASKSHNIFYAKSHIYRQKKQSTIFMHRLIMNVQDDQYCDHVNRNGLDNQKANLRSATNSQNQHNQDIHKGTSSQYKGVCLWKQQKHWKWYVSIRLNNKKLNLGSYYNEIVAALVYDQMAIKLFGKFARLNILSNPYVTNGGLDKITSNP